jgi:hypothetical protein
MSRKNPKHDIPSHRFAWDGFSFRVPADWNLSQYHFDKRVSSIQMEDDYSLRLEFEWMRPQRGVNETKLKKRYEKASKRLKKSAEETEQVDPVPPGWSAFLYTMPRKKHFVSAFWLAPDGGFFGFLQLHFEKAGGKQTPLRTLNVILSDFERHTGDVVPWAFYDVSLRLPASFRLVSTSFQAGNKLAVFQWGLRKLYVWRASLAEILLKERTLAAWAADFLNKHKDIQGPKFTVEDDTTVGAKRRRGYLLGHYDEISRMCFRYKTWCMHLPEQNAIVLAVFNYRRARDLATLATALASRPGDMVQGLME